MPDATNNNDLLRFIIEQSLNIQLFVSQPVVIGGLIIGLVAIGWSVGKTVWGPWKSFEIDEAELGVGNQKIRLKPNSIDQQVAYQIWVELTTRKIGLEIDLENDVISEIYDSWYNFFGITRAMIKEIPVSKVQKKSTQEIIRLSIDVLNTGLRPHLTKWQARFRRWYNKKLDDPNYAECTPQEIQKAFPQYDELTREMLDINKKLMSYRTQLYALVVGHNVT